MRRTTQLALLLAAFVVGAAVPVSASAAPSQPPPCSPPTFDGRLPAYVQGSSPASAVWMDPVVAAGDPVADPASTLRYVGPAEFAAISGDTVTFHLPLAVDGATLAFRGTDYPLSVSGATATWNIPADLFGREPALLGTTVSSHPGPSYLVRMLVQLPGSVPPAGPGPIIPQCNPPPPQVCAAYGARLTTTSGQAAQARIRVRRAATPVIRVRALALARRLDARAHDAQRRFAACTVSVPKVGGTSFTAALERLRAAGLLVAVPRFPRFPIALPEQGWNRLDDYLVAAETPPAGTRLARGATVRLSIAPPHWERPLGSLGIPLERSPFVAAPNFVGLTYRAVLHPPAAHLLAGAYAAAQTTDGLWVKLDQAPLLGAAASRCGEDAFVVAAQQPPAGTTMPTYGVIAGQLGVRPSISTITLTLTTSCSER
jgi:hypothetical protein